jgi:hypothetical protein
VPAVCHLSGLFADPDSACSYPGGPDSCRTATLATFPLAFAVSEPVTWSPSGRAARHPPAHWPDSALDISTMAHPDRAISSTADRHSRRASSPAMSPCRTPQPEPGARYQGQGIAATGHGAAHHLTWPDVGRTARVLASGDNGIVAPDPGSGRNYCPRR